MTRFGEGCLLCGAELVYADASVERTCFVCGTAAASTAACARGHFVCDGCHRTSGNDVIETVCLAATSTDPVALATEIMQSPAIAMHGPEHHFLVPAVLLTAYHNALGHPEQTLEALHEVRRRAERVPGGFCGTHGNCGAAVGTGIFWSVVTGARPLSTATWAESNRLTALSLLRIADHGGPRCCKRDTWHAILEARREIGRSRAELDWSNASTIPVCEHHQRNKQCLGAACVFHPDAVPGADGAGAGSP